jgi:hypothetical protein
MDPVTGLIFVLGVLWAARSSGRAVARSHRSHRAKAKQNATAHGTARNRAGSQRRVANAATLGYWANEVRHGLPDIKHGWAQGQREQRVALAGRETDAARHRADSEGIIARLRAEAAAHQHRLQVAQRQTSQPPTMSQQLRATPVRGAAGGQVTSPFPKGFTYRDPKTHHLIQVIDDQGNWIDLDAPDPENGHDPMTCKDPGCACHQKQPSPAAAGNGSAPPTGGTSVTDFNYEASVELADKLITAAEQGINDELVNQATQMADGLAGMIPDDSTTQGQAGELATTAEQIRELHKRLQDQATAMKDRLTTTYGQTHESVLASGERAAVAEFHDT